jgi:hypothetical protein
MLMSLRLPQEDALFAQLNGNSESIQWADPERVCCISGTLRLLLYEYSSLVCYYVIVGENGVQIVVTCGLDTCCDEPVEMID